MKSFCLSVIALCIFPLSQVLAQQDDQEEEDSFWNKGGGFSATFQQVALNNWAGGGKSSLALGGIMSAFLTFDDTTKRRWENRLEISYGLSRIGEDAERFIKSKDNLIFNSRYGRKLNERYYLSTLLDFRSQIAQGFKSEQVNDSISDDVKVSEFMAPGFLVASLGMTYSPKQRKLIEENDKVQKREGNYFAITLSPFSGKFTFVLDDTLAARNQYNTEEKKVKAEAGSSLTMGIRQELFKNVVFNTNLNLFAAYEKFQNVDVNLESLLVLRVNKYIMSNISLQLIYDDDTDVERDDGTIGPALQLQNAINVGFTYGF
ncbi:hypothetical protein OKW21_005564 [Catalinimonas alkaloidigena]|uniref:DUF3078 domain-containing protein n=1 Tax=Catalinimonas alkaloidigena TaxID=1075417 RepID=UPI002407125E|nr:DUF3078 domain-containing protein [Catalinimonas alkaloidigena]MDF9800301.1 hypothetical protein [Catalinimonas alkaloidigena]